MSQELLDKIHSRGYWRVNIRPTKYDKTLIESLSSCRDTIQTSNIRYRGWDYPQINARNLVNGDDWISCEADFMGLIEYWRFHQSGQFIHHFSMREDWELENKRPHIFTPLGNDSNAENFLEIVSTVYRVTEIMEFASRLASNGIFTEGAHISIELFNTENRQLFFYEPARLLFSNYVCKIPVITIKEVVTQTELLSQSSKIALVIVQKIFERFNWNDIPTNVLQNDQLKLLEKRL